MLEAQDYSHPQSQESPQDYNQSPETAQYSTPYFMSREELPQVKCNSLKTMKSPDWMPMNRVNISGQHGLHSLRTLRSTRWTLKLIQGQDAM